LYQQLVIISNSKNMKKIISSSLYSHYYS
jgi:hypothetical protein